MRYRSAHSRWLFFVLLAGVIGCGGGDDPTAIRPEEGTGRPSATEHASPSDDEDDFVMHITARGTASPLDQPGWVTLESDCTQSTTDAPKLGAVRLQIPETWEIAGFSSGSMTFRNASLRVRTGEGETNLSYSLESEWLHKPFPEAGLSPEDEEITSFPWSDGAVSLHFDGLAYKAFYPALTLGVPPERQALERRSGRFMAVLELGGGTRDDISNVPREEVVELFKSVRIHPCLADAISQAYSKSQVSLID